MTKELLEHFLDYSPHTLFDEWFAAAAEAEGEDVNAMSLATVAASGMPQVRTVLLKQHRDEKFIFYTNNESRKGESLRVNPLAALLFFWRGQRRQVLIEGTIKQMSQEESAPYYDTRPYDSRIAAWASAQSRALKSYRQLQEQVEEKKAQLQGAEPTIPPYWRGFCLSPTRIEFWQEEAFRLHQRLVFTRDDHNQWHGGLLQP